MTTTLTARRLITDIGSVLYPVITVEDGLITNIASEPTRPEIDTLTATFFDVHTHGAVGHDVMTATLAALSELQKFFATKGVAHYLPTTVTASIDDTLRALENLAEAVESKTPPNEARPIGIHLEGPFLSHAKRGVHAPHQIQPPDIDLFNRFHAAARGHIRLMTIAPEVPGALELIQHAVSLGVKVSIGHSNANAAEALGGIQHGASSATHTFNAMRALDHREPGILGTVLDDDRVFAELICDGIHVRPELVRLWLKAKGTDLAILVTDSMSATGMPDGPYSLAGFPVTVQNGRAALTDDPATLAGSILTMDQAVANVQRFTGIDCGLAARLASHNPAAMLGIPELARIDQGSPANLNRFSPEGKLVATYLHGELV